MGVGLVVVEMPSISCICPLMILTRIWSRMEPMMAPENLSSSTKAPGCSSGTGEARKEPRNNRAEEEIILFQN